MAWFDCTVGGKGKAEIIVTCSSDYAGTAITCTNGTDTYTQICPSVAPYTVTFKVKADTWTISGVVGGVTYSDIVDVTAFTADLAIPVSFTLYSAPYDVISYNDNGTTAVLGTTDANGELSVSLYPKTYTLISSVAKDPDNLSNAYTKSITISSGTSSVYLMPDDALYWYGFEKTPITYIQQSNAGALNKNTNNITIAHQVTSTANNTIVYTQNTFDLSGKSKISIIIGFSDAATYLETLGYASSIVNNTTFQKQLTVSTGTQYASYILPNSSLGNQYVGYETNGYPQLSTIYALFVE